MSWLIDYVRSNNDNATRRQKREKHFEIYCSFSVSFTPGLGIVAGLASVVESSAV